MIEFRCTWNTKDSDKLRVVFVEAENSLDARKIATDYIERKFGVHGRVQNVAVADPVPAGRVLERK